MIILLSFSNFFHMSNIYVNCNTKKYSISYFRKKKIRCLIGKNGIGKKIEKVILKHQKGHLRLEESITEKTISKFKIGNSNL